MDKIKNIKIENGDTQISIFWDKISECSGYKIKIYKDPARKSLLKTRYAESSKKTLLGFKNGVQLYLTVTPFSKTGGKEKFGPESDVIPFTPVSKVFKLNRKTLILDISETFQIEGEKNNEEIKNMSFSEYDPDLVSISSTGLVTALAKGDTIIKVTNENDKRDYCTLKVSVGREASTPMTHDINFYKKKADGSYSRQKNRCVISLMGDLMCTDLSQRQSLKNNRYDFTQAFTRIRPLLQKSDLNVGVLETCISHSAPYESELKRLDNGAPNCNSPAEFLDAIEYAGFNALITANNHCCDTGIKGLEDTINQIEKHHLINIGCRISESDEPFAIFNINKIKIAILAFNCVKNGSENLFYSSSLGFMLADYDFTKAQEQINCIKEKYTPDFIITYMHWGVMNSSEVTQMQRTIAKQLVSLGVNFIVGSHPHVLQEIEKITVGKQSATCIYSLGNFFSAMSELQGNRDSAIIQITLTKSENLDIDYELIHTRTVNINTGYVVENCSSLIDFDRPDLVCSMQRIRKSIIPDFKNTRARVKQMTIGRFIKEIDGKPNFDISAVSNQILTRNQITYYKTDVSNCVYFDFPFNEKPNPCHIERNLAKLKKNCLLFITSTPIEGFNCIVVDSASKAYLHYASWYRRCFNTKVVGITGSIGKTTVKGLIASVLSERFTVDCTSESKNVPIAVADNVLRFNENVEYFVMEMASSQPGQIHKSTLVAQPDACVISRIGTAHIDVMKTQENICNTKFQILDGANSSAPIILNYDDPFLREYSVPNEHEIISYGIDSENVHYTAKNIREKKGKIYFDICFGEETRKDFCICIPGIHNVYNALAAYSIGKWAGMNDTDIRLGLMKYRSDGLRQNIVDIKENKLIIDCYNASLLSIKGGIDVLAHYAPAKNGNRIAIVGDMVSEGSDSEKSHREVGAYAADNNIDQLIAYGDQMRYAADEFEKRGGKSIFFDDKSDLIDYLKLNINSGNVILIKGSRAMQMEDIIKGVFPSLNL